MKFQLRDARNRVAYSRLDTFDERFGVFFVFLLRCLCDVAMSICRSGRILASHASFILVNMNLLNVELSSIFSNLFKYTV